MSTAPDCIFCAIVAGRAPAERLYEDERTLAFMDIKPVVPGHALVIPKRHCLDLRDCAPEDLGPLMAAVQRVAPALVRAADAEAFNFIAANGVGAGQEVFHFHIHLWPRKRGDGLAARPLRDAVKGAPVRPHAELRPMAEKTRALLR